MSEHQEQVTLFNMIRILDLPELEWLFAIPNGGFRHPVIAKQMKAEGVKAGVWDIFLPVAKKNYHGLFIEMKFGQNTLTDNQKKFEKFVNKQGYLTKIAYNWKEALDILLDYLSITLKDGFYV